MCVGQSIEATAVAAERAAPAVKRNGVTLDDVLKNIEIELRKDRTRYPDGLQRAKDCLDKCPPVNGVTRLDRLKAFLREGKHPKSSEWLKDIEEAAERETCPEPALDLNPSPVAMCSPNDLQPFSPIEALFSRDGELVSQMTDLMTTKGFDHGHPLKAVSKKGVLYVYSGLTRKNAASAANLKLIPVIVSHGLTDEEIELEGIQDNLMRRQCTDAWPFWTNRQ